MSEVKLRLAVRDLYRGEGGRLSSYDEGWNDGVDAAVKVLYAAPNIEGDKMTATPRTDAEAASHIGMSSISAGWYVHADFARDLERENAELAAAVARETVLALECIDAWESACDWSSYASEYFREKHGAERDQDKLDEARDRLVMLQMKPAAIKAAQQPVGYDTLPDSKFDAKYKHVGVSPHVQPDGWVSEQDAKIKRLSEALRDFEDAAYGRGTEDLRELHAEALRDAGVTK
jgi:hypothetical protein